MPNNLREAVARSIANAAATSGWSEPAFANAALTTIASHLGVTVEALESGAVKEALAAALNVANAPATCGDHISTALSDALPQLCSALDRLTPEKSDG
jgi:hypothetical protein